MGVNRVDLKNGETLIDLSKDTVNPDVVQQGYTGHDARGNPFVGRAVPGGGSSVEEIFWVTADLDPNTLSAFNVSHTYDEIMQASLGGKLVKLKGFIGGMQQEYVVGEASYIGGLTEKIIFAVFLRMNLSGNIQLLYINMTLLPNNEIQVEPCIVSTTNIGG